MTRAELKQEAKNQLAGQWLKIGFSLFAVGFIFGLVSYIPFIGFIVVMLISGALEFGVTSYSMKLARNEEVQFSCLFSGFNYLFKALGLMLLMMLFVFLWSLLFIIPGIVKAYGYSMAFYILVENPEMGVYECLKESTRITQGYKFDLFVLELSFLGWGLLGALALTLSMGIVIAGITGFSIGVTILGGILYLASLMAMIIFLSPYMLQTYTNMYFNLK